MAHNHHSKIKSRLDRLNTRLSSMVTHISSVYEGVTYLPSPPYTTLTQAKKALKAIPREVRVDYEKSIRKDG